LNYNPDCNPDYNLDIMEPLHQNILAATGTIVYVKFVIGGCDFAVSRNLLPPKISRKIIHIAAGSWLIFWPLFSEDHWSWRLNILVPAIYSVQLFVQGAIIKNKEDQDVKTMTRTGNPSELLFGPLFFTLIMNTMGLFFFRKEEAIFVMACLGFGDGLAPLAGEYFPFGMYPTFPFGPNDKKTLTGSLGFFCGSIIGYYCLRFAAVNTSGDFESVLQISALCAVTEGISGIFDNILVAIVAYFASTSL